MLTENEVRDNLSKTDPNLKILFCSVLVDFQQKLLAQVMKVIGQGIGVRVYGGSVKQDPGPLQ